MKEAKRIAGAIVILWLLLPPAARADPVFRGEEEFKRFPPFSLTFQAGEMFPGGQEGSGLKKGPQFVGSLSYEVSRTFTLAGDVGLVASRDDFKTRIVLFGLHGRLYPSVDMPWFYVEVGSALYHLGYTRPASLALPPANKIRPGLSFSIGYDALEVGNLTFGVLGGYHGIVVARSDALAYVLLGVYASLRPSPW